MAKEEIVGGLKAALARNEPLQKAMMSFYNAGYSKEDIEDAVQELQTPQFFGQPVAQTQPVKQSVQSSAQSITQSPSKVVQKVSKYDAKPKSAGKTITIIFVFLLLLLLGILAAVVLFREELANFFNNIL